MKQSLKGVVVHKLMGKSIQITVSTLNYISILFVTSCGDERR